MNNGTQLKGRILWYDGDSSFEPDALYEHVLAGHKITGQEFITEFTKDIRLFNSLNPDIQLEKKSELRELDTGWNIPKKYMKLDVPKYILGKLLKEIDNNPDFRQSDIEERLERVEEEITLYNKYKLLDILRVVIYIVESFEENDVVWGTGRGSSCCSYCLYLIGLHDVDSIEYGLELTEFFR